MQLHTKMGWNQTRPMGTGANRVGSHTNAGGKPIGKTVLQGHPSGQQRIGPHPNQRNAKTAIRTATPNGVGFKNRVGTKGY